MIKKENKEVFISRDGELFSTRKECADKNFQIILGNYIETIPNRTALINLKWSILYDLIIDNPNIINDALQCYLDDLAEPLEKKNAKNQV